MQAIQIIEAEHRSLAAVLHGMLYLMREIRFGGAEPDFELLRTMIVYIETFPERFHHPKEDAYLFKALMVRYPAAEPLIERLQRQHDESSKRIRELHAALARYEKQGASRFAKFARLVAEYAAFHWDHMRTEENEVLPLCRTQLTADDWQVIDAAFLGNGDPMFGAGPLGEYRDLFRRIVNLAPPPVGVGRR